MGRHPKAGGTGFALIQRTPSIPRDTAQQAGEEGAAGTRRLRARVHGPVGRLLRQLCRPVRVRSRPIRPGTTHAGLPQRTGQSARVLEVLVPQNAGPFVHLRERNATGLNAALPLEASWVRVLHHGADTRGGQTLLPEGNANRAGEGGDSLRHRACHVPADVRQQGLWTGLAGHDEGREALTH